MTWRLLALAVCMLICVGAGAATAADPVARLLAIGGHWQGTSDNGRIVRLKYAPTARGSVLVETWQEGTAGETMSVFHRDGNRIMATHYCGQGNQPRLVLEPGSDDDLVFDYLDATNLADADASHLVRLRFVIHDDGSLDRIETYRHAGTDESSRLHLRRVEERDPASGHGS